MSEPLRTSPRLAEHCGAVHRLRIRTDVPAATEVQPRHRAGFALRARTG